MYLTGYCNSEFNLMDQDWINKKSKRIFVDVLPECKKKIISHWKLMGYAPPIFDGGRISINISGKQNLNSVQNKWMKYYCSVVRYTSKKGRGAKLVLKEISDSVS